MKHNIVWFRSDLRTIDNPALTAALDSTPRNQVRGVFVITEQQWQQHDWGANKIGFVLQSVLALEQHLTKLRIPLDIISCTDFKATTQTLQNYLSGYDCDGIYFNREYEFNEQQRDIHVSKRLIQNNIKVHAFDSQTIIAPGVILTKQQTPYTVFTPFKKSCYEYLYRNQVQVMPCPKAQKVLDDDKNGVNNIESKFDKYLQNPILRRWPAGQTQALSVLKEFCTSAITKYQETRDFPAIDGTSKLSAHLAVGSISAKQCLVAALNANQQKLAEGNANISCWISELIWRDFYRQIMFHFPHICKGKNFNRKYDALPWNKTGANLSLWQQGKTGVPIIDAAMRQLVATGWMHNRLRMLVAMFLTKNLLIDWRHGEKFFSQHLIDLDFASNNGGWQWSASTGTDAAPYFRIFNPVTQSAKFDANGEFIKQYCPELSALSSKQIHDPSSSLTASEFAKLKYPKIMVSLSESRVRAIESFKSL